MANGRLLKSSILFYILCLIFSLGVSSCSELEDAVDVPVREFFELMSNSAQIVDFEIVSASSIAKDSAGNLCVGSEDDVVVKFTLRNPQSFTFVADTNLFFNLVDSTVAEFAGASGITLEQGSDLTVLYLTYPKEFLVEAEFGKNIGELIKLFHPVSGDALDSYNFKLYCNTAPPKIKDVVVYTDTNPVSATYNKYIIGFTVPALDAATQSDLVYLEIGGTTIAIDPTTGSPFSYTNASLVQGNINSVTGYTPNGKRYASTGGSSFYFITNDTASTADKIYTLSLIDSAGITTSTSVNANSYQLDDVKLTHVSSGTVYEGVSETNPTAETIELSQDSKKSYAKVRISVPTSATGTAGTKSVSGVTVSYSVTNSNTSTATEGSSSSAFALNLLPGTNTITCTAHKDMYVDSVTTFTVKVEATNVFVSQTGSDTTGDGSEDNPFATIGHADIWLGSFGSASTAVEKTIYVISNLNDSANASASVNSVSHADYIDCGGFTLTDVTISMEGGVLKDATIAGTNTNRTITGSNISLKNVVLAKVYTDEEIEAHKETVKGTGSVSLNGVTSAKGNVVTGTISIDGKVSGLTFALASGQKIAVNGSMAGSGVNTVVLTNVTDVPSSGNPRVFTDGYASSNSAVSPSKYFKNSDYGVTTNASGEAVLILSGGSYEIEELTVSASSVSSITYGSSAQFTFTAEYLGEDISSKATWTYTLTSYGFDVTALSKTLGVSYSGNTVTFSTNALGVGLPVGNYQLTAKASYKDTDNNIDVSPQDCAVDFTVTLD